MLQKLFDQLNEAMNAIQSLQVQPTEHNCGRICAALGAIREAAKIAIEINKKIPAEPDPAAAPEEAAEREEGAYE